MPPENFENKYDMISDKSHIIFSKNYNKIAEQLLLKMENFKSEYINTLISNMKDDIFYDGTVYTGSAGIALYFYTCAKHKNENNFDLLKTAWSYLNLSKLKGKRISSLCGDAGPLALAAVISYKLGSDKPNDIPNYEVWVQRLVGLESLLAESPDELLYGRSGYLFSLLFVNKQIGKQVIPESYIKQVIKAILHSGQKLSAKMKYQTPLLWQWHDKIYLGAAHGIAGILYLLLQAQEYVDSSDMKHLIKPTLDWLVDQQYSSGNFPSSLNSNSGDRLVQWCHGAPGFTPLLLLAHQIYNEDQYLMKAIQCGDVVWSRGLCAKGYSICHGVSGNAYTFIQLYQATKDPVHLYRACCFVEWCVSTRPNTEKHFPDRPASLFEGLTGRLHITEELNNIMEAKFPAFTL